MILLGFISLHFKCHALISGSSRGRFETEARFRAGTNVCQPPKVLVSIPRVCSPPRESALAAEVTLGKTLNDKMLERTFPTGD